MGKSIDEVIEGALYHSVYHPEKYDPQKAHEYYLRTRDLKGRRHGSAPVPHNGRGGPHSKKAPAHHGFSPTTQKKIAALTARLHKLEARLHELLASKGKGGVNKDHHKTAADKTKAARDSKQYREKHKAEIATKQKHAAKKSGGKGGHSGGSHGVGSMTETQVRAAIKEVRANLQAAVAKARKG